MERPPKPGRDPFHRSEEDRESAGRRVRNPSPDVIRLFLSSVGVLLMKTLSRRQFLLVSGLLTVSCPLPFSVASSRGRELEGADGFPVTISVLKAACTSEMSAHRHYDGYCRKAVDEGFGNIAYLFRAFSVSEKIHADNYKRILASWGEGVQIPEIQISLSDTKANLKKAAEKELVKIMKTYPDFLADLEKESHDEAVVNCMYSWKSHRQHEEEIRRILKHCKRFFGLVAKRIEQLKLDFHVCRICGSTLDEPPRTACVICNHPVSYYRKIDRPT